MEHLVLAPEKKRNTVRSDMPLIIYKKLIVEGQGQISVQQNNNEIIKDIKWNGLIFKILPGTSIAHFRINLDFDIQVNLKIELIIWMQSLDIGMKIEKNLGLDLTYAITEFDL